MQNLYEDNLKKVLKSDPRLIVDGALNKNKIEELALEMDADLLKLLMSDPDLKKHFFTAVDDVQVFDKIKFQRFINNKSFLPDSYTAYKNKIGLTDDNGNFISESREVVLSWPHKDCVLEGGQDKEDAKRDEIFFNEILAPDQIDHLLEPKVLTNFKKYDANGEHDVTGITYNDNLLIKGNNLLALHSLEKVYAGKVKLIYIDPPYNTGDDSFRYNDRFNHSTWLTFMKNRLMSAKSLLKEDGTIFVQCDDSEQAYLKVLLDEVFGENNFINTISVNLKNVAGASGGGEDKKLKKNIEYIHVYSKNYLMLNRFKSVYEYTPIDELVQTYKEEGVSWKYTSVLVSEGRKKYIASTVDGNGDEIKIYAHHDPDIKSVNQVMKTEGLTEQEVYKKYSKYIFQTAMPQSSIRPRVMSKVQEVGYNTDLHSIEYTPKTGKNKGQIYSQFYKGEKFRLFAWLSDVSQEIDGVLHKRDAQGTYWDFVKETKNLSKEGKVELLSGKKPERLLEKIIYMATDEGDLVLDYHLGSGTTCAVAMKINRRFIGVEQLDYGENDSVVRLQRVIEGENSGVSQDVKWQGGGSFVYCELAKCNQNFIDLVMDSKDDKALIGLLDTIKDKGFISYKVDKDKFDGFEALSFDDKKKFLIEVLDKNMLYVNLSEIEDKDHGVSDKDIQLNRLFYSLEKQQQAFAE